MTTEPLAPRPETKDWTFVIEQPSEDCGFDPASVDVHSGFAARVAAAVDGRYRELAPAAVAADLTAGAAAMTARFDALGTSEWTHRGLRSYGSAFTTETLAGYFLHDLEHHVHDVAG